MGKISEKFLNAFSLNDDEEEEGYDEYEEEEYPEDTAEPDNNGPFSKTKKQNAPEEKTPKPVRRKSTPINRNPVQQEVCVIKPSTVDDSKEISETILTGKAVIINCEGLHVEISQRIMDFVSGTCYAIDGNLQKISDYIFIATPNFVDISGDFQELIGDSNNAYDISGFKSPIL